MFSHGWALIQNDWCLSKKRRFGQDVQRGAPGAHTHRAIIPTSGYREKVANLPAKEGGLVSKPSLPTL